MLSDAANSVINQWRVTRQTTLTRHGAISSAPSSPCSSACCYASPARGRQARPRSHRLGPARPGSARAAPKFADGQWARAAGSARMGRTRGTRPDRRRNSPRNSPSRPRDCRPWCKGLRRQGRPAARARAAGASQIERRPTPRGARPPIRAVPRVGHLPRVHGHLVPRVGHLVPRVGHLPRVGHSSRGRSRSDRGCRSPHLQSE